jgi:hypothetical protein
MKHRFLLHSLSHTFLVVDITGVLMQAESCPKEGQDQTVPVLRLRSWRDAERHFLRLGADAEALGAATEWLRKAGVAVLTIT